MEYDYKKLADILASQSEERMIDGMPCIYKKSPDTPEGYMDVRESMIAHAKKADMTARPENYPKNMIDNIPHLFTDPNAGGGYVFDGIPIGYLRASMGWDNVDMSQGVETTSLCIEGRHGDIPLRVYTPSGPEKNRGCMMFIHGGGFMGGSLDVVENPCKLIAQLADIVVVSVDYRLCPEHRFPAGFDDCYDTLSWIYEEGCEKLHIDPEKLCVGGDSAGGNLSAVCCLKDRDEGKHRIKYAALLYPTVMRTDGSEYEGYHWSREMYNNKGSDAEVDRAVSGIREMNPIVNKAYLDNEADVHNPYVAPLSAKNLENLPKTLIVNAEYDFLTAEGCLYAKRCKAAGVDVRWMIYGGVGHAFIDKLGFFPQAQDCIAEIVKDLKEL